MQLAIVQAAEVGLFQVPFLPWEVLCWIFWAFFAIGGLLQWLVLKKARSGWAAWVLPGLLVLGLLAGEIGCQTITGWERLAPLFGWWLCLAVLLGVAAVTAVRAVRRRTRGS